jgi:hypothetical protein
VHVAAQHARGVFDGASSELRVLRDQRHRQSRSSWIPTSEERRTCGRFFERRQPTFSQRLRMLSFPRELEASAADTAGALPLRSETVRKCGPFLGIRGSLEIERPSSSSLVSR